MAIKVRGPAVAKPPGPNATVATDIYGVFAKSREKQMAESMKDALAKMEREDVAYAAQVKLVQEQTKLVASEIEHLQTIKANAEKDFAKRSDSVKEFNDIVMPIVKSQEMFVEYFRSKGYTFDNLDNLITDLHEINVPNKQKNDKINKKRKVAELI